MKQRDSLSIENCINNMLIKLKMPAIKEVWKNTIERSIKEGIGFDECLLILLEQEAESRGLKRINRIVKGSQLPLEKSLQNYEMKELSPSVRHQIAYLKNGQFIKDKTNILCFGNPGSGKTHLLCGLALHLAKEGYKVKYQSCNMLIQELLAAKQSLKLPAYIKMLNKNDILVLDELGYIAQNQQEMEVLFSLISSCYERTSILMTSNLPFSKWETIFKDKMMTVAVIDRLVHHSVILEMNHTSYRIKMANNRKKQEVQA